MDCVLSLKIDTVRCRRKRSRGVKKRGAADVAMARDGVSGFQGAGFGHGQGQPKLPGTQPTGASTGVLISKSPGRPLTYPSKFIWKFLFFWLSSIFDFGA